MKAFRFLTSTIAFFADLSSAGSIPKRTVPAVVTFSLQRHFHSVKDNLLYSRGETASVKSQIIQSRLNRYSTKVAVGKSAEGASAQIIRLFVDTGTSDTWFNSAEPAFCSQRSNGCAEYGTFEPRNSMTNHFISKKPVAGAASAKSSVSGDSEKDTLGIGDQDVKGVQLALATKSRVRYGTLTIGYSAHEFETLPGKDEYQTLPQLMVDQGLIKINAYSMYLNSPNAAAGSILYGGVDAAKYDGEFTTLSVQKVNGKYKQFIVALARITFPGLESKPYSALLDFGYTNSHLPSDIANSIWRLIGAVQGKDGNPVVGCSLADSELTVDFEFGSNKIRVPISQLVYTNHERIPSLPKGSCDFGIWAQEDGRPVVLGDSFLRNAYVVYDLDNNEVSIAPARLTEKSKIVELDRSGVRKLQVSNANKSTRDLSTTESSEPDDSRSEEEDSGDSEEDRGPSIQIKDVKMKSFGLNIHIGGDEEESSPGAGNYANDPSYRVNHVHRPDVENSLSEADLSNARSRNPTSNPQSPSGSDSGSGEEDEGVHDGMTDIVKIQPDEESSTTKEGESSATDSNAGGSEGDEEEEEEEEEPSTSKEEKPSETEPDNSDGKDEEEPSTQKEEKTSTIDSSSGDGEIDAFAPGDSSYQDPSTGDTKQNQVVDLDNTNLAASKTEAEQEDTFPLITERLPPGTPSEDQLIKENSPPSNDTSKKPSTADQTTHAAQTSASAISSSGWIRHGDHISASTNAKNTITAPPPGTVFNAKSNPPTPAEQITAFKAPPAKAARAVFFPRRASRNERRRRRGFGV